MLTMQRFDSNAQAHPLHPFLPSLRKSPQGHATPPHLIG
jgi:hypothetical protein